MENYVKVSARVKHMHPWGKDLLYAEWLQSSRNLPSKLFQTKTPLSSHSLVRSIMMLCKKWKPFRSRINAGLLRDRETLATAYMELLWGKPGTCSHTMSAGPCRTRPATGTARPKDTGYGTWQHPANITLELTSLWFSKSTYIKKAGKQWKI